MLTQKGTELEEILALGLLAILLGCNGFALRA